MLTLEMLDHLHPNDNKDHFSTSASAIIFVYVAHGSVIQTSMDIHGIRRMDTQPEIDHILVNT